MPTTSALVQPEMTSPTIRVEELISILDVPWEMAFDPYGQILLTERCRTIGIINDGQLQSTPWMAVDMSTIRKGDQLGLALDPRFTENH